MDFNWTEWRKWEERERWRDDSDAKLERNGSKNTRFHFQFVSVFLFSQTSSSFNSMFGMPLLIGNCLPVSGHSKLPSTISISSKMWCNFFRKSSSAPDVCCSVNSAGNSSLHPIISAPAHTVGQSNRDKSLVKKAALNSASTSAWFVTYGKWTKCCYHFWSLLELSLIALNSHLISKDNRLSHLLCILMWENCMSRFSFRFVLRFFF